MTVTTQPKRRPGSVALPSLEEWSLGRTLLVAAVCSLPILLYAPFFNSPFMRDEGYYASAAQGMLHGGVPYTDFFDNKPPLIYVWYAASFLLFGETVWAPRLLASVTVSVASLFVFLNARLLFESHRSGIIAGLAFAACVGLAKIAETNANTEFFMLLPMTSGLYAFLQARRTGGKWWYAVAGALGGVTVLTKTIYAIPMAFLFAFAVLQNRAALNEQATVWSRKAWSGPSLMIAGSLAVFAVVALPLLALGAFGEMIEALTYYSLVYSGDVTLLTRTVTVVKSPLFLLMHSGPLLALAVYGGWLLIRGKGQPTGVLLAGWFLANLVSITAVGRFYNHYYVVLFPAMALLVPTGLEAVLAAKRSAGRALLMRVSLAALAITPLLFTFYIYGQSDPTQRHLAKYGSDMRTNWEAQSPGLGQWLKERTTPDDYIYNFGFQSELYFYADRQPPTRFFFDHAFGLDTKYEDEAIRELSENPPLYIADSAIYERKTALNYYSERVHEWIVQNYDYLGQYYYADIYVLKGRGL
jgi:4-amino-4-deoxy-L-arabinose transferase-like glycosyltransferase